MKARQTLENSMKQQRILGMDEAGYGPNLGPLVIAITDWNVPDHLEFRSELAFWESLKTVVSQRATRDQTLLHIGDSKAVYSPSKGIASLERSVLALASVVGISTGSFREFFSQITSQNVSELDAIDWYRDVDLQLPIKASRLQIEHDAKRLQAEFDRNNISLQTLQAKLIFPAPFNAALEGGWNKAEVLSHNSLNLFHSTWVEKARSKEVRSTAKLPSQTILYADKHGGRNRYADLLIETCGGQLPRVVCESTHLSEYQIKTTTLKFQTQSERYFPVAVASMCAKYLREISMMLFNQYWQKQVPGLKPTKGYPTDARRFLAEIETTSLAKQTCRTILWRNK